MASQSINFRPQSLIQQIPWSVDKKAALGALLILVTFSLVGWLYLGQASVITSSTLRVDELRQDIELLTQQNNELALEIARAKSISLVETRARNLGFIPADPSHIRYLRIDQPMLLETKDPQINVSMRLQPDETFWSDWLRPLQVWITGSSVE